MQVVAKEKLETLAASRPTPPREERRFAPGRNGHKEEFDLAGWIAEHNVPVKREGPWERGGYRRVLEECPWNGHTDHSAYIVQLPNGAIAAGCQHDSCQGYGWRDLREHYEPGAYEPKGSDKDEGAGGPEGEMEGKKPTQAELLIRYADKARLFHTPDGEAHATVQVDDHRENWPVKSKRFTQFLLRQFYEDWGRAPSAQALTDARATIAARAHFDSPETPVYVRIAGHEGAVYLDLCNDRWEAVEITATSWRVISDPPVKFVRKNNAATLPRPIAGGSLKDLRPFFNVRTEEDFILVVAWMVGALNPDGPYPVAVFQGEQGSAKSTQVRVVRSIVDPAVEPLRAPPRDERDLAIAASGNWIPALDNLSGIRGWLSDALCRLATGGGFATRELYSDDQEVLFSHKRPVILNGIDSLAVAGDLRDRSLIIDLPDIPKNKKKTERKFYRELEAVRPKVLGALLDAVTAALRNLDEVKLEELPRMADFAVWVAAAEEELPWERGEFVKAYTGNRTEANELALDTDPVAVAVRGLMARREEWSGTPAELYAALVGLLDDDVRRSKAWPAAPNALSNRMKRIAPALREAGIEYEDVRKSGGSRERYKRIKKGSAKDRPDRPDRPAGQETPANSEDGTGTVGEDAGRSRDDTPAKTVPDEIPANEHVRGDRDGRDDGLRPDSNVRLAPLLDDRPEWLREQVRKCLEEGRPGRLLKPLASSIAVEYLGNVHRWREALSFVEKNLEKLV